MQQLSRIFFRGLFTLIPLALTVYIIYIAIAILERDFLGKVLRLLMKDAYIPGLSLVLTIVFILFFGLVLNNYITQKFFHFLEERLLRIPFVKAIYSPLRDLMNLFSKENQGSMKSVVMVEVTDNVQLIGLITRDSFEDLDMNHLGDEKVAVYIPLSYSLGGYTLIVPKSKVQEVPIPIEKAMSLAITGWVKTDHKEGSQ